MTRLYQASTLAECHRAGIPQHLWPHYVGAGCVPTFEVRRAVPPNGFNTYYKSTSANFWSAYHERLKDALRLAKARRKRSLQDCANCQPLDRLVQWLHAKVADVPSHWKWPTEAQAEVEASNDLANCPCSYWLLPPWLHSC